MVNKVMGDALGRPSMLLTDRLCLRPVVLLDTPAIHEFKSDPLVTSSYGQEPHRTVEETRAWVAKRTADQVGQDSLFWAITERGCEKAVGECCLWNFDPALRCAEVGYELRPTHWGRGLMAEAMTAVIAHGFSDIGLNRLEALPLARNIASQRLLLKLGFKQEGMMRQRCLFRGLFEDQLFYGLLRAEWAGAPAGPKPPTR